MNDHKRGGEGKQERDKERQEARTEGKQEGDRNSGKKYLKSSVATHVNYQEDVIAGSYTLPRARPYVPPVSAMKSQNYYKTHTPGSPMPKMPDPEPPKSPNSSRRGTPREGGAEQEGETRNEDIPSINAYDQVGTLVDFNDGIGTSPGMGMSPRNDN